MSPLFAAWLAVAPPQPQWDAPQGCPGQDEVDAQVELLLLEPVDAPFPYQGRIELAPDGFLYVLLRGYARARGHGPRAGPGHGQARIRGRRTSIRL